MRRLALPVALVAGATLIALTLGRSPGTGTFYLLSGALAGVWILGALIAGVGTQVAGQARRIIPGAIVGLITFAVFLVGDLVVRLIGPLHDEVHRVLGRADTGNFTLVVAIAVLNGIGEELFFRGALYSALARGRRPPAVTSTVIYLVVTAFAWNPLLLFAALLMGPLWAVERRVSRGVTASVVSHVVWSVLIIVALPR